MRVAVVLAALTLTFCLAPFADAQSLGKIARKSGLSPEDFRIMGATARGLYDVPSPPVGRIVSWTNAESGSHGRVRLAAIRKNCAFIQHFVHPKGAQKSTELRVQWCKDASGTWLMH